MKYLFSRFGGQALIFGKGKASDKDLPKDQSLDNMLDNHSTEIINNLFYVSSYDMLPEFMGAYKYLEKGAVKLGDIKHLFSEILLQNDIEVVTSVYIAHHQYDNTFAIFIKTGKSELKYIVEDYVETYDYVLTVFFKNQNHNFKENPKLLEKILLILFFKMDLQHSLIKFTPSKTYLGNRISPEFISTLEETVNSITNEEELSSYLKNKFSENKLEN